MLTFLARRLALALVTLVLLSVIVFALGQMLPGDVGRNVLGGFASQESVDAFNKEHGLDRPAVTQYLDWASHAVRGDFGTSYTSGESVNSILARALPKSAELALFAFVLMIPLAFIGGLDLRAQGLPATGSHHQHRRPLADRRAGVRLGAARDRRLRHRARAGCPSPRAGPTGANILVQLEYLLLPALVLVGVLFGYVSRMVRAGTIEALDADYTRTAYLKGLGLRTVLFKHVLRNALLPTIAVVATQTGYLLGGLVIVERAFNYPGHGPGDRQPRRAQGLPRRAGRARW